MNKNRQRVITAKRSIAFATAATIAVGSISYAQDSTTTLVSQEQTGPIAGVFATTAQIESDASSSPVLIKELKYSDITRTQADAIDFENLIMADVSDALNIRKEPNLESEVIGQMTENSIATVVSLIDDGEWAQIESGEVSGYILTKYTLTGEKAKERYDELNVSYIKNTVNLLNVRSTPSTDGDIIMKISYGSCLDINNNVPMDDEWVPVIVGETFGYVSREYVEIIETDMTTAITAEQMEAERLERIKQAEAFKAEQAARAASISISTPEAIKNSAIAANAEEETLLAALIQCESGSYDGMLAVAGVVLNRLRAGYAGNIHGVIFQKGQFSPARTGKLDRILSAGPSETALAAAREALSGTDITGGCKSFRSAKTGKSGINIGGNVFF